MVEAILIFIEALLIIREGVMKLIKPGDEFMDPTLMIAGIAVMGISTLTNAYVSSRLMKVAKATDSVALKSDAWHLKTDVYMSVGVLVGLVLIHITRIQILDSIVAICVALVIMKAAYDLSRKAWNDIIDHRLSDDE